MNKWYKNNGVIIAFIILFFPVGIFLMWKYAHWNKTVKWVLTVICGIILLSLSNSSSSVNNKIITTTNKIPVVSVKKTRAVPEIKKPKITPEPTDPCEGVAGTSMYAPCEDSIAPAEPKLNATVKTSDQYLIVTNNSNMDWTDCYVSIGSDINPNDFYQQDPSSSSSIPAGGTFNFSWGNIVKLDGTRFNFTNTAPNDIIVGCNVGNNGTGIWTNYP